MTISRVTFICALTTAFLLVLLFETGLLPSGIADRGTQASYWMGFVAVALTLIAIPLALKWQRIKIINKMFTGSADGADVSPAATTVGSAVCRIAALYVPLIIDIVCYYLFGREATYAYMALMLIVAFAFVWPRSEK